MKRIIVALLLIMICGMNFVSAKVQEENYCAQPKDVGNAFTTGVSNVTGANFLSTKAAELAIQKSIKSQLGSRVNVEIYPYTFGALLNGKFKKMTISSKRLNLDGLQVSKFKSSTLCGYNHVGVNDNNLIFKENFLMDFSAKITNDDLKKTMASTQFLKAVDSARISTFGQTLLKVTYMNIYVKNNKIVMDMKIMSPVLGGTYQKAITATSNLAIKNGKIIYSNLNIRNTNLPSPIMQGLISVINLINPFMTEIKLSKYTSGYTKLNNVIINNDEIQIDGILFVPKNN